MEIGAVMGAAPRKNVIRENSDPGDIIILLGGRTGRDGCGGVCACAVQPIGVAAVHLFSVLKERKGQASIEKE